MLKFITGNKNKVAEINKILHPFKVDQLNIDLAEIQKVDPKKVIEHKIKEALKHQKGNFFIEDTCVYFGALKNKLPGPFIRWFTEVLEPKGLYELAKKLGDLNAEMRTTIGYAKNARQVYFFEGIIKGALVKPKGNGGFGMDPIFKPNNSAKTLAELKELGITEFSARFRAAVKFKKFLLK